MTIWDPAGSGDPLPAPPRFDPLGAPSSVAPSAAVRLLAAASDRLVTAAPRAGMRTTALAARFANRLGLYGVSSGRVARLLPGLDARTARRVAAAAASSTAASGRLTRAIRGGHGRIAARLLDPGALGRFRRDVAGLSGAVVVSFHLGPFSAIRAAFDQTAIRCLYLQMDADGSARSDAETAAVGRDGDSMAAALWRARRWVAEGGVAVVLPDSGLGAPTAPLRCLGRSITFSRGAFALARIAGVPLVPIRCRWARGRTAVVERWPPEIPPPGGARDEGAGWEARAAQQVADRVGDWIGREPEALNLEWIALLERSPLAALSADPGGRHPAGR